MSSSWIVRVHGLTVQVPASMAAVAGAVVDHDAAADVIVRERIVPLIPPADGPTVHSSSVETVVTSGTRLRLTAVRGRLVVVERTSVVDASTLAQFVFGRGLAAVLYQRGSLLLHGSAIRGPRGAVLFLGPKGSGKSTIAAALALQGYPLIVDDIGALCSRTLRLLGDRALPRLTSDAMALLGFNAAPGRRDKISLRMEPVLRGEAHTVDRIYELGHGNDDQYVVERLPVLAGANMVWSNRFHPPLQPQQVVAAQFQTTVDLVSRVGCARLLRPTGADLQHVTTLIIDDLSRANANGAPGAVA